MNQYYSAKQKHPSIFRLLSTTALVVASSTLAIGFSKPTDAFQGTVTLNETNESVTVTGPSPIQIVDEATLIDDVAGVGVAGGTGVRENGMALSVTVTWSSDIALTNTADIDQFIGIAAFGYTEDNVTGTVDVSIDQVGDVSLLHDGLSEAVGGLRPHRIW